MIKSGITIKELAKKLGCAPSTVSKALNDSHEISLITKKKIRKAANKYNYTPNLYAVALRKKSNIV